MLAAVIVLAGVLAVALPVSILVARFPVEYEAFERASQIEAEAFRRKLTATLRATTIVNLTRRGSKALFAVPWVATIGSRSVSAKDDSSKRAMPPAFMAPAAARVVYDASHDDAAGTILTPKWQRSGVHADDATGLQLDDNEEDGSGEARSLQAGGGDVLHPFHMQFLLADSRAMQADVAAIGTRLDDLLHTLDPSLSLTSATPSPGTDAPVVPPANPEPPPPPLSPGQGGDNAQHATPVEAAVVALENVCIEILASAGPSAGHPSPAEGTHDGASQP